LASNQLGRGRLCTSGGICAARADALVPGTPVRNAEYASELYYSLHPIDWLELQPNIQFIHHPGGIRGADDVAVLGLKAALVL